GDAVHGVGPGSLIADALGRLTHGPGHLAVTGFETVEVAIGLGRAAVGQVAAAHQNTVHLLEVGGAVLAAVHIAVSVGDDDTRHAAFAAQEVGAQGRAGCTSLHAEAGEGGHGVEGAAFHDGKFKGAQVDFADGLLVDPGAHTVAVGFLVVQRAVLVVDMDALFLDGRALGCAHHAGKGAALAEVLAGTAGVGR